MENIDIKEILSLLPHRYPFLLVDKVVNLDLGNTIQGVKNVTFNEPHFFGHFPDYPIMPGVLIIESLAQIAAVLVAKSFPVDNAQKKLVYLLGIDQAKFRSPVVPGDVLSLNAEFIRQRRNMWKLKTFAMVQAKIVAEATITAGIQDR